MNHGNLTMRTALAACLAAALVVFAAPCQARAQGGGRGGGGRGAGGSNAAQSAQASAPVDLTGYWVALVTEDWRWRMVTPKKGDFPSIPLNPAGRDLANTWDPAKDEAAGDQCKSYGAGNVMGCRPDSILPGRMRTR